VTARQVRDFVSRIRASAVAETKKTRSLNENRVRKTKVGYSSEAVIDKAGGGVAVTVDVLAAD